ncbi:MAG TPA: serpin family protein, partial [Coriobacteriia bacterium]|nr:serpin family protein [Coriobacteriia bacterium]
APTEPKRIVCDRPYLFAIVDEASGAMLFLGAVNDPNE